MAVFLGNPEVKTFIVDRRIGSNISKGSSQCPIFSHLFLEWDLSVLHSNCLSSTQELSQWAHPLCRMLVFLLSTLQQGSPSPGSVPRVLVRNWVAPQRVKSRCVSEASSVFTAVPLHSLHHLSSTSFQISSGIINIMHLSHPEQPLAPSWGKIVFHQTGPWCQKGWGLFCCCCLVAKSCPILL